ncbi:MAG: PKD domain-containing protein [Permianibacter sp.]
MRKKLPIWCSAFLVAAVTFTAQAAQVDTAATELAAARKPREESWQILQRQRWFAETRGLQQQTDAGQLRQNAVQALRLQVERLQFSQMLAGETWEEMGPSSMLMGNWTMGRVSGRSNAIVPHPSDESILYFGAAAGGVWKTINGGASWTPVFDQVGTLPIGAIHLESSNPNHVWVGTGDRNGGGCAGYFGQGVFLSTDGGNSWQMRNGSGSSAMPLSIINSVAVQPNNNQVVLVGGFGSCSSTGNLQNAGLYRSIDRGGSWSLVLNGRVEDMFFVPGSSTVYAAVAGSGVYRSLDGGANWNSVSSGLNASGTRLRLAMAPSNPNILYALNGANLYRTADGGASWQLRNSNACEGQCTYNLALAVHPTQPDTILVGSIRYARSTNGGSNLSYLTTSWGSGQKVHQDTHVLVYSRSNGNRFWVGSDGGIWRTDDGGSNYVNLNANLNVTQFYDIAVHPSNSDTIFGGAQDNSSSRRTTGDVWNLTIVNGDGFMNVVDPSNSNTVLQAGYPSGGYPNLYRSLSGGAPGTFASLPRTGLSSGNFPWVTPLAAAGTQVFVASDRVYRGTTSASSFSWTSISGALGSAVSVIAPLQRGAAYPTYVGTSGGAIYYSADAGAGSVSWSNVSGNYAGGRVADIAIDAGNPQRVFVARAGFGASRLYRSLTGGGNWTAVGAGLPNVPANAVAIDPFDSNRIFVGTDIGVYESTDGGDSFTAFSTGLPLGIVVSDLEIDNDPYVLVAGTYGRGAWRAQLGGGGGNQAPLASFNHSVVGLTANFVDTSTDPDGSIASRSWDFGDGSSSTQANPSKSYASAGSYTVMLTVTDNLGSSASTSKTVTVGAGCPGTTLNGSFSGSNGQTQIQPGGSWYQSTSAGVHAACLSGAGGTDYDLYFDRWNGSSWVQVAKSDSPSSSETISYNGTAGYYRYRVVNYSGTGSYTLTYSRP